MKKFFSLFAALMCFSTMFAQNQSNYAGSSKFTDNVSVIVQAGTITSLNSFYDGHTMMAPTVTFGIEKYITPIFGFGMDVRTVIATGNENSRFNTHPAVDAVNVSGYLKYNVLNSFDYKNDRHFFEPVVYTGLGWGHNTCSDTEVRNYMTYRSGVALNFNFGQNKDIALVVNPAVVWGDLDNGKLSKSHGNFEINIGLAYHFKNSNDKHCWSNAKLYDEIEVATLNATIKDLKSQLDKKPTVVVKEIEKVVEKTVVQQSQYVVLFAQNSTELTNDAKNILDAINTEVDVVAYASPEGSDEYNKNLSVKRANEVANYLIARGVKVNHIDGRGVNGETSNRIAVITIR